MGSEPSGRPGRDAPIEEYERWYRTLDRQIRLLERERQKFSAVVNHTDIGFILVDAELRIAWANQAFAERFGGVSSWADLPGTRCQNALCRREKPCDDCPALDCFRSGAVAHREIRVESGGRIRHLYATAVPVLSPTGAVEESIIMLQDVSDLEILRQSQEALRASEERFRSIFENVAVGMVTNAFDGTFVQANPAFCDMLGYRRDELLAMKIADVTHPDDRRESLRLVEELIAGRRRSIDVEKRYVRKDGRVFWGRTTAVRVPGSPGQPGYTVGVVRDITDREEARAALQEREEQLRHSQKMEAVGKLAGGIAHDFNNLLTSISGYADLLMARLGHDDPLRREALEIARAAQRAASLTRQLLAFGSKQVLRPRVLDLNAVVRNVNEMLRRIIGEDVRLTTRLDPELGAVKADPGQLQTVLANLAVNAREAMPEGGELVVETANAELPEDEARRCGLAAGGAYVVLHVGDNGVGMDAETRSRVFEPFFTTKERGRGTGLGLSTVYGIVRQTGGHVDVESVPGKGTSFRVYLPREARGAPTVTEPGACAEVPAGGSETVLLVEDDEAVRSLAHEILEMNGFRVVAAADGVDAMALHARHDGPIDLLLTDLVMPRMGGFELVAKLAPLRPAMKVLLMSGYADGATGRPDAIVENTGFLQKPFTPQQLSCTVREVIDRGLPARRLVRGTDELPSGR